MLQFLNPTQKLLLKAIKKDLARGAAAGGGGRDGGGRDGGGKKPKMVPHIAKKFHNYRPSYHTKVGLVTATMRKVDVSPVSGETVAYYDLVIRDPVTGLIETNTYLYGYRNEQIVKIKEFPTKYRRG